MIRLSKRELVRKLAYHFNKSIQVSKITHGIGTLEVLLVTLMQWEDMMQNKSRNTEHKIKLTTENKSFTGNSNRIKILRNLKLSMKLNHGIKLAKYTL